MIKEDNQQLINVFGLNDQQIEEVAKLLIFKPDIYIESYKIFDNKSITNNKYTAIAELACKNPNKSRDNRYYYIIVCNDCGYIKRLNRRDFMKYITCRKCKTSKDRDSYLGIHGIYDVLSLDHVGSRRELYYKCKCLLCGKISIVPKRNIEVNKSCDRCNEQTLDSVLHVYYNTYKDNAETRNLPFELTFSQFKEIINKDCYYCGEPPSERNHLNHYKNFNDLILVNGIDRIDSQKGYTLDNCVPCCSMCNRMKNNYSIDQFKNKIAQIYKYLISSETIENTSKDGSEQSTLQANGNGNMENPSKD